MIQNVKTVAHFLKNILNARRLRNGKYSIRAFARDIKIPAGRLNEYINGKRLPSLRTVHMLSENLALSLAEKNQLVEIFNNQSRTEPLISFGEKLDEIDERLLSEWIHFAILSLFETEDFSDSINSIAQRFSVSANIVQDSISLLLKKGLLKKYRNTYVLTHRRITTSHDVPSVALRRAQDENIKLSLKSLHSDSIEMRDFTSITMAIDPEKIIQAKTEIAKFRRRISKILETGKRLEVYNLNIQLFPLSKVRSKK